MTDWRFYGREAELETLEADLRRPEFDALAIRGRRGIGKSTLVTEAASRVGDGPPLLMFELRPPGQESIEDAGMRLLVAVRDELGDDILDGQPDPDPDATGPMRFADIIRHLLLRNAAVCLDEFHYAEGLGLTGPIKCLIDGSGPYGKPPRTGKLIVTGSHQQRFDEMFRDGQPLFRRFRVAVALKQWRVPTVLGMAEEQRFLRNPGRFLTLWTAFGGIPRKWEGFAHGFDSVRLRDFAAWPDDRSWRLAFLDWQHRRLEDNPEERFDYRSHIELAEPHREVLLWLARNAPRGAALREFPAGLRRADRDPPLKESLEVLSCYLELMEQTREFQGGGEGRWSVADNNTLFQISVFPEFFDMKIRQRLPDRPRSLPDERLQPLEGRALRRLAADWLGSLTGVTCARQGVRRRRRNLPVANPEGTSPPPLDDVDVLGLQGELSDPDPILFVGGCKRNPHRHDPARLDRQADELLDDLGQGMDADRIGSLARQGFLVSPEFTAEHRRRYGASGRVCVDIPGMRLMAKELERSPEMDPVRLMLLADRRQLNMEDGHGPAEGEPDPEAGGPDHHGMSGSGN